MNIATAETLIHGRAMDCGTTGKEGPALDQVLEVDGQEDSLILSVIDFCMLLLVYLGPVVAFGYLVAPVVVRLLSMPVPA